jgi:hypothetical protein
MELQRREHLAQLAGARRELETVKREIRTIMQAIKNGGSARTLNEQRDAAREALRGFLDKIVIPPGDGLLQVVGNFGAMLAAAEGRAPRASAVGSVGCGGVQPAVLAAVEWGGLRWIETAYDGAADVSKARTCAAIASVPLSVLPKTTRT